MAALRAGRSGRTMGIVAAAVAAVLLIGALADGRLLVADPDPSAVTAADVRLARSLVGGATPPEALVAVCLDDAGTIDPACLGDGAGAEEIVAEVVPRACREAATVPAGCIERELGIEVPDRCTDPGGGVDVSCLTGTGSLLVLTDQCLEGDRLRRECLTDGVYGVPDAEGADSLLDDLAFGGAGVGTGPDREPTPPAESDEPPPPSPTSSADDDGRDLGETLAVAIQVAALALLVGLAVYLLVVGVRSLLRPRPEPVDDEAQPDAGAADRDREIMAASMVAGAERLGAAAGGPGGAIIAAYALLLEGLAACAQGRRPSETPLEHLERVLAALDVRPEPLRELTALFGEARFSDHAMTDHQRDRAGAALRVAAADLDRVRQRVG